jgi:uncharacterized protein (DUF983 family)
MFSGPIYSFAGKINESCAHCGFKFEIEPGYWYAAMYVSYALNVAEGVTLGVATYILTASESPWLYLTVILLGCVILAPINFRYSRIFLLYWLSPKVHYHPALDTDDPKTDA